MLYSDSLHCMALYDDILLSISRGEPSLHFLEAATALISEEARKCARGVRLMIAINADAPAPGDEAREHIKRVYPDLSRHLRGLVLVVEGEGFAAAAKRSVAAIIYLTLRLHCPSKVVGSVTEGATWLMRETATTPAPRHDATDIVLAVQELRAQHDAAMPQHR
jgi:hypothetical protein